MRRLGELGVRHLKVFEKPFFVSHLSHQNESEVLRALSDWHNFRTPKIGVYHLQLAARRTSRNSIPIVGRRNRLRSARANA
jgi:hypothetical protein